MRERGKEKEKKHTKREKEGEITKHTDKIKQRKRENKIKEHIQKWIKDEKRKWNRMQEEAIKE